MDSSAAGLGIIGGALTLLILLVAGFLWLCVAFAVFGINGRVHKIGDNLERIRGEVEYLRYALVIGLQLEEHRQADGRLVYSRAAQALPSP